MKPLFYLSKSLILLGFRNLKFAQIKLPVYLNEKFSYCVIGLDLISCSSIPLESAILLAFEIFSLVVKKNWLVSFLPEAYKSLASSDKRVAN